ncbi:hypothetical protein ASPCADRAFT_2302 [Aspergillus carbonarius ITEM 5010]|uniref:Uncharacterized protein n=1 Tax=Aspergillus carbonarius (strain ITEM 5010) TaxID=602072 RepID=A0A1R3RWL8_ASPC5|nr:hypothetical protein ASPCADRAFT_2302 [Aspergillus carbonarius ITEM 5010]
MSGSPRPVPRRRKRDSTAQALDHLNGLMNTQKHPTPMKKPHAPTPHPSRRFTYSGRQVSPSDLGQLPSPKTLPSKPRRVLPTELLTPRRSLRFSEPIPDEFTPGGSTRKLRRHGSPQRRHEIGQQLEEPSDDGNPEETETSVGDAIHMGDQQTETEDQVEVSEPSDDELGSEDEGPLQENDEVLDGEGLRSDVELFSDNDNSFPFAQCSPSSSSGKDIPARVQPESPSDSESAQPADRQHSNSNRSSPIKQTSTIAVEITRTEEYSSSISVTTEARHFTDIPVTDDAQRADQGADLEDTTLSEDSIYQPPEESSSSVPSPDITSSESDSQHHSGKSSPEASSPPKQSNKRKRPPITYLEATSPVNTQPGQKVTPAAPEAGSLVSSKKRVREHPHSHSQEDPESHHTTKSVQEDPVSQEPTPQDEPAREELTVTGQSRRPERLEDSSWFKEALKLNDQSSNWKKLTQKAHALENQARLTPTAKFEGIRHDIFCLIEMYTNIIDNLTDDTGPSNHDVRTCALSHEKIARQGRGHLEDVYNLSTEGSKDRGQSLVEGFEKFVVPLLVRLILVCFQAYHAKSRLFPEANDHLHQAMEGLLGLCDQIHGLIKGQYVDYHAVSPGIRLPLRQLLKSLEDQRVERRHLSEITDSNNRGRTNFPTTAERRREWTDEEGHALVEGLQRFQGPNRYYQICKTYSEELGKRGMREVRRESERLHRRIFPQIQELVRTEKGRQEWEWLLKVRE